MSERDLRSTNSDSAANQSQDGRPKQLRRPMAGTQERLRNGTPTGSSSNSQSSSPSVSPRKQTTLSVNAPEFVPKHFTQPPPGFVQPPPQAQAGQGDVQFRPNLSVTAAEFVPRSHNSVYAHNQSNLFEDFQRLVSITPSHNTNPVTKPTSEAVINDFKTILFNMTIQPGNIEEYLISIVNSLKNVTDEQIVRDIIEILFEQCVTEPNFRYTGARVCKYLSKELKHVKVFSNFRGQFLTRCKEDYLKKDDWVYNEETIPRLCGFTMFIGELFLTFEAEMPDGTYQKIGVLRFVLRDLLLALLSHPTDTTVKCATQLLKLTGATIEETANLNKPEEGDYSKIFEALHHLDGSSDLNKTSNLLIKSVLNLKASNWGRQESSFQAPAPSQQRMYPPPQTYSQTDVQKSSLQNEPVFYNQQGQTITREEAGYFDPDYSDYNLEQAAAAYACLQDQEGYQRDMNMFPNGMQGYQLGGGVPNYSNPYSGEYQSWSNPDDSSYDEEYKAYAEIQDYGENYMDDEMEAAYEEFLRSQHQ